MKNVIARRLNRRSNLLIISAMMLLVGLSACRGGGEIKCKGSTDYMSAREALPVKAPDDLDNLDKLRELPVPEASPQTVEVQEGECLDSPPDLGE